MDITKFSTSAIAGGVAGSVTRLITAPLDVLKIRFQLQFPKSPQYASVLGALKLIVKEEGVISLWKG